MATNHVLDILRCPHCTPRGKEGLLCCDDNWLICNEPECGRRYPIHKGLPIMLTKEGDFFGYRKRFEAGSDEGENG